jgi:hypothetical protein
MQGRYLRAKFEAVSNRWRFDGRIRRLGGAQRVERWGKPADRVKSKPAFTCHEGLRLSNL